MGTREALREHTQRARRADPESEQELYPRWQQGQYMWSMFGAHCTALDNGRYPSVRWTSLDDTLQQIFKR